MKESQDLISQDQADNFRKINRALDLQSADMNRHYLIMQRSISSLQNQVREQREVIKYLDRSIRLLFVFCIACAAISLVFWTLGF